VQFVGEQPRYPRLEVRSGPAPAYPAGSLLTVQHLTLTDVAEILRTADVLQQMPAKKRKALLENHCVALLFYESSTRTRTSFELAAKSLGATTTLVSDKSSSIEKGESLKDTGITLRALGARCIILRHPASGAPFVLARTTGLPVLNAGDGMHQHPSQALLDLRTIVKSLDLNERPIDADLLRGVTVAITGDIRHSRVARSNAMLLPRLGAKVLLCGPEALLPEEARALGDGIEIVRDFDAAVERSQVLMMLRIQRERLAGLHIDLPEYMTHYQLTEARAERLVRWVPNGIVMHPGPMIRGLEIQGEVADGGRSKIEAQVEHGSWIRAALLLRGFGIRV
jgi:aspartate carbamoyltransferase catalytic subunit